MAWDQNDDWLTDADFKIIDIDVEVKQIQIVQPIQPVQPIQNFQPVEHVQTRKRKLRFQLDSFFLKIPKNGSF